MRPIRTIGGHWGLLGGLGSCLGSNGSYDVEELNLNYSDMDIYIYI